MQGGEKWFTTNGTTESFVDKKTHLCVLPMTDAAKTL
jgi:hypothetical protein